MTARKRLVPLDEVKKMFDYLKQEGIDLSRCGVDIGADYVKVLPPANSNVGGDSVASYINRDPHSSPPDNQR